MSQHTALSAADITKISQLFGITIKLEPVDYPIQGDKISQVLVDTIDPMGLASWLLDADWMRCKKTTTGLNEIKVVWRNGDQWECLHLPSIMAASQDAIHLPNDEIVEIRTIPYRDVYLFFLSTDGAGSLSVTHPLFSFFIPKHRWKDSEKLDSYLRAVASPPIKALPAEQPQLEGKLSHIQQFRDFFNGMCQAFTEDAKSEIGYHTPKAVQVIRLTPPERVPVPHKVEGKWIVAGYQGYYMEFLFDVDGNYIGAAIGD